MDGPLAGWTEDSTEARTHPWAATVPRWLDANQQAAWRTLVSVITRLPAALDTQTQRDSDLTHFEYFTLALLSEAPDRRAQLSVLAESANASLSRLSHVITRLANAAGCTASDPR